jgi:hypothetical protein
MVSTVAWRIRSGVAYRALPLTCYLPTARVEKYLQSLVTKTKPKAILVCMIYFPDETRTMSWATLPLRLLGYERDPAKLQFLIRTAYQSATL